MVYGTFGQALGTRSSVVNNVTIENHGDERMASGSEASIKRIAKLFPLS